MFQADFSQAGAAVVPSPSIWSDCPGVNLNETGAGFYVHEDFILGTENFVNKVGVGSVGLTIDADAGSTIPHRTGGTLTAGAGLQDVAVTNTINFAAALYTQPLGSVVVNSGNKIWFEARITLQALTAQGLFIGIAAEPGLNKGVLANGTASVAAGLIGDSLLGFTVQQDNQSKVYLVIRKDAGAPTTLVSDVTNATALGSAASNLVAGTYVKLGFRFDGKRTVFAYVNGIQVGKATITTASINVADAMGAILGMKTGAGTALTNTYDWVRVAFQNRR